MAVLWEQIRGAGHVRITRGPIVDRAGSSITAEILVLGNFTAAYRTPDEVGFLNYLPAGRKLFALSKLPPGHMQKQLRQYMQGRAEAVPMDISRGAALGQLTHAMRLWQQIPKGGPLVWPILAVLALGVVIVVERVVFLLRKRMDADDLTRRIETMAARQDWQPIQDEASIINVLCLRLALACIVIIQSLSIDRGLPRALVLCGSPERAPLASVVGTISIGAAPCG